MGAGARPSAHPSRLDRVGVQLYTVRSLMAEDVERTLEAVAAIGYREVEFAGYFERTPAGLRATLDGLGLEAPATHYGLNVFRDRLDEAIEVSATLGHRYLVLPSLPTAERSTLDDYLRLFDEMNRIGEACGRAGLGFAYHNHAFEFEPTGGAVPFDLLLERTDPDLVHVEIDLFWTVEGGGDPLAYFEAHPGRFRLCHVKDRTPDGTMVDVGKGVIDFRAIFDRSAQAGFEHYFVEHDQPADPLASISASFDHIAAMSDG